MAHLALPLHHPAPLGTALLSLSLLLEPASLQPRGRLEHTVVGRFRGRPADMDSDLALGL